MQHNEQSAGDASETRRSVGIPTSVARHPPDYERAEVVRAARVRVVGSAFLRWRPIIVLPVALGQLLAMNFGAGDLVVPGAQRASLALAMGTLVVFFIAEAIAVSRRPVTERWLFVSLALTAGGITIGVALSGGVASPLLPIVLAPLVVAFAAFGQRRTTAWLSLGVVVAVASVAVAGQLDALPWGVPPAPALPWMRLIAFCGAVALAWVGVARLADAYAEAGELLERLRFEAIAEAASRLRDVAQMSAKVAHELKNPLAAVKALVQLEAHRRDHDERATTRLAVVLSEIDRMEGLTRDYLAFARPVAALQRTRFDAAELLRDVALVLSARATQAGVRLVIAPGHGELDADRSRLREALFNLVDNALRVTPAGHSVELAVAQTDTGLRLEVRDFGPGLEPHIAAAFAQGDTAFLTTRLDGTGLGLTIARAAVMQHGGQLAFQSRVGGGSIAIIDLPGDRS